MANEVNRIEAPYSYHPQSGPYGLFFYLFRRKNLLSFHQDGRIWLTYLAVGIITLMDEFTSIFYVPAESYRFIGLSAIVFIAITSLLIRFISTRLTEIAEILEHHQLIGGGVYSFSYLVLGPWSPSWRCPPSWWTISSPPASPRSVRCPTPPPSFPGFQTASIVAVLVIIWSVAGLNILGIRENARFTFLIFVAAAFVILNLIVSGILNLDARSVGQMHKQLMIPSGM